MTDRIVTLRDNSNNKVYPVGFAPAGAVTTSMYTDASITTPKLADGSVTTSKLANNSVTADKLAPGAISVDDIYPIGSIYMSVNSTNPGTLFGGTWEQIKDTFLLSAGDTYTAGTTGGEAEHSLIIDEIPSHTHTAEMCGITASGSGAAQQGDFYRADYWNRFQTTGNAVHDYYGTGTLTPQSVGGGLAHNNMPPYLTVYMWKRTA